MAYSELDIRYNNLDKRAAQEKRQTIYTSDRIKQLIKDLGRGRDIDMAPFYHGDINLRDSGVIFEYTEEELKEFEKCSEDPIYFISKYCKFMNDKGRTTVKLRDYQEDIITMLAEEIYDEEIDEMKPKNKHNILLQSRQSGKTTTVSAYFTWYVCFHTDRNLAIVANKGDTAKQIIKLVKEIYEGLPYFIKPGLVRWQETSVTFENGCYLKCATTNPTSVTGSTCHVLYVDEAAHIPVNMMDDFWKSVYPTLSSSRVSQIIVSSTPKGKRNIFYKLYNGAIKGENDFRHYRVDWWQVPGHDEQWYLTERKNFGAENFDQEYGLQFDVETSKLVRGKDLKLFKRISKKFVHVDIDGLDKQYSDKIFWDPDFDIVHFGMEDFYRRKFVLSIDTAEGTEVGIKGKKDSDYNVINIFEVQPMSAAHIRHNQKIWAGTEMSSLECIQLKQVGVYIDNERDEEMSSAVCKDLVFNVFKCGKPFNLNAEQFIDNCRILIEMNFNGKNFVNKIKAHPMFYDDIILKTYHVKPIPGQKQEKKFGYKTTGGAHGKGYYCERGSKLISKRQIIVSQEHDNINYSSIGQLQNFGKNDKGVYEGTACHDDIAITVLFLSRLFEDEMDEFKIWIEEFFDLLPNIITKNILVKQLLKKFIDENPELSDADFNDFFIDNTNQASMLYGIQYNGMNMGQMPRYNQQGLSPISGAFLSGYFNKQH